MDIISYKCPCCGAPLTYDGGSDSMDCDSCGNSFKVEDVRRFEAETAESEKESCFDWGEYTCTPAGETVIYTCPSCGGEIIGDSATAAAKCPYCDNSAVMKEHISGTVKPDYIIPFKKTKAEAEAALKEFYKGKKLLPDCFKDENRIKEIRGIYVPFWLFDCETNAHITYDATRVSSWTAGDYRYTKTDHFAAIREGNIEFSRIPVDGSSKMNDDFMDSLEPFDYGEAIPFESAYLSGYLADKFDVDAKSSMPRAGERVENSTETLFRDTVIGYTGVLPRSKSIRVNRGSVKYILMPVWVLNTRYNGELYTFAMNGQTGKLIGNLPVDKGKYLRRLLGITLGIALPLIALLFGLMGGGVI